MKSSTALESRRVSLAPWAGLALALFAGCGAPPSADVAARQSAARVDNPYVGATGYVNSDWEANAAAASGGPVAKMPTAIWLDSIGSITGKYGGMSLSQHFDAALAQGAGYIQIVLDDLPGRHCELYQFDGDLPVGELASYQANFIDAIAAIEGDSKYASLRIINVVEPDSLANLVVNVGTSTASNACAAIRANGDYVKGIQYALGKLGALPNVYNYLDVANHGVLGWSTDLSMAADLLASTVTGATGGATTVTGIATNVAGYAPTVEPFFTVTTVVNGVPVRQSKWVDWNDYVDEQSYAVAMRAALVSRGLSSNLGIVIDTSRNGWGGSARPTGPSKSTDVDGFVNESRIDRRYHAGNWCNQKGAGLGERPRAIGANGVHAYAWIKPPGESDGTGTTIAQGTENPAGEGSDPMCDPNYGGSASNGFSPTGALPNAPVKGRWFPALFQQLLVNQYPMYACATAPTAPTGLVAKVVSSTQITIMWNGVAASCSPVTYDVFRGTTKIASGISATAFADTGLSPNTAYSYTVVAVYSTSVSMTSDPVSASTLSSGACTVIPATPTNVSYTSPASWQTKLTWTAVIAPSNCTVTYSVLRNDQVIASGLTQPTYLDPNSLSGVASTYRVVAVDEAGQSPASEPAGPAACLDVMPAVGALTTVGVSSSEIDLSWTVVMGCYTGTITYDVFRSTSQDFTPSASNRVATGLSTTSLADKGLAAATTYFYVVEPVYSGGALSPSNPVKGTTLGAPTCTAVPPTPTGLATKTVSATQVTLVWTAVTSPTSCSVTYRVVRDGNVIATGISSPTYTDTNPGSPKSYTVAAEDAAGISAPSTPVYFACVALAPMLQATATAVSSSQINLTWAVTPSCGPQPASYDVFRSTTKGFTPSAGNRVATGLTATSFASTSLTPGTTYYFVVQGNYASHSITVSASAATTGSAPGLEVQYWTHLTSAASNQIGPMLKVVNSGTSAVTLSNVTVRYFFSPEGAASLKYACDYAPKGCANVTSKFGTLNGSSFLELGFTSNAGSLAAGQNTEVQGRIFKTDWSNFNQANDFSFDGTKAAYADWDHVAVYVKGVLAWGLEPAPVTPTDTTPPSVPTGLTYKFVQFADGVSGGGVLVLSWTASTDNVAVAGYDVYAGTKLVSSVTGTDTGTALSALGDGTYSFTVKAKDLAGNVSAASAALIVSINHGCDGTYPILTNVKVTIVSPTVVIISWDPPAADSCWGIDDPVIVYEIYNGSVLVGTTTQTSLTISNLSPSTTYSFTIKTRDAAGNVSPGTSPILVTMPAAVTDTTPPSVPTGLAYEFLGTDGGYLQLTWTASTDNVGVAGYDVYSGTTLVASVTGTDTGSKLESLAVGSYSFTVRAKDLAGNVSAASTPLAVTINPVCMYPPSAPANVRVTPVVYTDTLVSWTPSEPSSGCPAVVNYGVYAGGTLIANTSETSVTVKGLSFGTTYLFTVVARDAAGNLSSTSAPVSYTVIWAEPPEPPSTPTNVVASNVTATSVDLTWTASTDNVGVVAYLVYSSGTQIGSTTINSAKIANLKPNTAYSLTVKAADATGTLSGDSAPVTFQTLPAIDTTPPSAPTLEASITSLSVTLSWSGSTDDVGVVAYDLYEEGVEAGFLDAKLVASTTSTSVTWFDLSGRMNVSGTYMVRARDAAGNVSPPSNPVDVRFNETPDPQPPSTPANLVATPFGTGVVLSWNASTDYHGQPVARYDLYIGSVYVGSVDLNSASIIGLDKGVSYAFTVWAIDVEGNVSSPSNAVTVTF